MVSERVGTRKQTYPTRGLGGEVDHRTDDYWSNNGAPQHQPPREVVLDSAKRDRDNITECDTKRSPHLPLHDQSTADRGRGAFRSVDGSGSGFWADSKTEDKTGDEELWPGISKRFPYRGKTSDDARPKDTPAATN